jgi:hypothetical protein
MWGEEVDLWETLETDEEFDLCDWASARGVDLDAIDEATGERVLTLWSWDMCGE